MAYGNEYTMENLLPIVAGLADKYTSKESSSVDADTAQKLMSSVIYCINTCWENISEGVASDTIPKAEVLYRKGYENVLDRVRQAKALFDGITESFEDYGCLNYRDTVIKGMPAFFLKYDAKFDSANHILTLDYPLLANNPDACGVNLIYEYLKGITVESKLLSCFHREDVINLLCKMQADYRQLYMDNLCLPVLTCAVGCVIAEKPVEKLSLTEEDSEELAFYFKGESTGQIEFKLRKLLRMIISRMPVKDNSAYFEKMCHNLAVRIRNAVENNAISYIFFLAQE